MRNRYNERKKIELKNVTKIFGHSVDKALEMLGKGVSHKEVMKKTRCAVGAHNVSLDIPEGKTFVIMGLSGSGKSTIIRCINRLNEPTAGSVCIDGEDITQFDKTRLRELRRHKVAMVFQHFGLLSHRNVIENVEYGLEIKKIDKETRKKVALKALETVGLGGWEQYYPKQLSGGMKQRVGLARALANDPDILLMDEPFSALDPLIRRDMQSELLDLQDKMEKTIVFITHDMNEAFILGDMIALMKDGEVVQVGTPGDFLENPKNDYVKSFIEDIDKTRILKVRSIMEEPPLVFSLRESAHDAYEKMARAEVPAVYVLDDQKHIAGIVVCDDLTGTDECTLADAVRDDYTSVRRNVYIKDVLPLAEKSVYPLAVVDAAGVFRGIVTRTGLISGMV